MKWQRRSCFADDCCCCAAVVAPLHRRAATASRPCQASTRWIRRSSQQTQDHSAPAQLLSGKQAAQNQRGHRLRRAPSAAAQTEHMAPPQSLSLDNSTARPARSRSPLPLSPGAAASLMTASAHLRCSDRAHGASTHRSQRPFSLPSLAAAAAALPWRTTTSRRLPPPGCWVQGMDGYKAAVWNGSLRPGCCAAAAVVGVVVTPMRRV